MDERPARRQTRAEVEDEDKKGIEPSATVTARLTMAQKVLPVVYDRAGFTVNFMGWVTVGFVAGAGTAGGVGALVGGGGPTTLGVTAGAAITLNPSLVERMLNAANTAGRALVTPAGRTFQKHLDRAVSIFGERTENASINARQGAELVARILRDPAAQVGTKFHDV